MMTELPRCAVLYMAPFSGWGARERGLIREARQARMLGVEVVICCPLESYVHVEAKRHSLETFPIRPVKKGRWFGAYREVFNFLKRRHQLTHFHCYDVTSLFSVAMFLRRHPEVALLWSIHGSMPVVGQRWWQRILLSRTDRFLLPSSLSMSRVANQYGVSAHKIARVGLAIDEREVSWEKPSFEAGFFVGASLPDSPDALKTVEVAAQALALVLARGLTKTKLLLHTPRDWTSSVWREQIEEVIAKLNLTDSVEYIGGEDFSAFTGRLHMNIASEGLEVPYDQIEMCLLAAVPVVHPRNRAYRELLHDIEVGLWSYKPGDARELAEKILKLHENIEKYCDAIAKSKDKLSHWHNPELVREKLRQVYEYTMKRRARYWRRLNVL